MKKPALFLACVIVLVIILSLVQVVVSNRLSTTGLMLGKLEEESAFYKNQNSLLSEKLLLASSFTHLASTAAEFGFVEGKSQVSLTSPLPIAFR